MAAWSPALSQSIATERGILIRGAVAIPAQPDQQRRGCLSRLGGMMSLKDKDERRKYNTEYNRKYYINHYNRERRRERNHLCRKLAKEKVYSHYGNICSGCEESESSVLSIDHINGGGRKHHEKVGSGYPFYVWLIKNNFPSEYRTLCMNCQFRAKFGKPLPMEKARFVLERLLERARQRCGYIEPCAGKNWEESITVERGRTMLWYNDAGHNTRVEIEEVEE